MNVWVSEHAADRFIERVRPGLGRRGARLELCRLLALFGRRVPQPEWALDFDLVGSRFCVEVSDGIVAVVDPENLTGSWPIVVTVLVRGGHREFDLGRRARKAQKRRAARNRKRFERHLRSERRLPDVDEAA